ncbi:MAG: hypothetical protein JWN25_745 [Verrucomicrobiales bacterium]|nr:hypothetical protein [Verrucomicrobiales bacterium]
MLGGSFWGASVLRWTLVHNGLDISFLKTETSPALVQDDPLSHNLSEVIEYLLSEKFHPLSIASERKQLGLYKGK